ncbi:MAG: hypothetical protein K2J34_00065, partial [Muribaculaceae bacterium]|nr:hypothetical protein [Muribaculaceae bacterium]
ATAAKRKRISAESFVFMMYYIVLKNLISTLIFRQKGRYARLVRPPAAISSGHENARLLSA